MPSRPLLLLPRPETTARPRRKPGFPSVNHPSTSRQAARLSPRFEALQQALAARRARLGAEAGDIVPEEVVVLETVGPIQKFVDAVRRVPELEWLAEVELDDLQPDEDFYEEEPKGPRQDSTGIRGRLFMVFTNQQAMNQMQSLWDRWLAEGHLPRGFGGWSELFKLLHDIRPWGVSDRLAGTGLLDDWAEFIEKNDDPVTVELQLWFRSSSDTRRQARARVVALVESEAGQVMAESEIEGIEYHGLLVRLPGSSVRRVLESPNSDVELIQCEQIRFFRPTGQFAVPVVDDILPVDHGASDDRRVSSEPIVALLDGLPLTGHKRLTGRILLDDPDGYDLDYAAKSRQHGTAMASLIIHGDLNSGESPLGSPLYVRPVLQPDGAAGPRINESFPSDVLIPDLLFRSVRRLFDGEAGLPPAAPTVVVVNLSIGIQDFPFFREMSPVARLLDWLSWRYKVLFVVSAGNHSGPFELGMHKADISKFLPGSLEGHMIRAAAGDARSRRLLPPAESINALTVGATHDDDSRSLPPPNWIDPLPMEGLPSPINALGMGYRRAIKPDVLAPGGRIAIQQRLPTSGPTELDIYDRSLAPGQLVAAPGGRQGDTSGTRYVRGTSNAAALVSRQAALLYEQLDELRDELGGEAIDEIPPAIWLKALVVHSADWGSTEGVLRGALNGTGDSRAIQERVTRLLGYGSVDFNRVKECTVNRVTALGGGKLGVDEAQIHRFPLPPSLSGKRGHRRLTITLAWFSPVNPRHRGWRQASLSFSPPSDGLSVKREQAHWQTVQRGTVQHEILEGTAAAAYGPGTSLEIRVDCKADSGTFDDAVDYALAVSLEVSEEIDVDVYSEVRERVLAAHSMVAATA